MKTLISLSSWIILLMGVGTLAQENDIYNFNMLRQNDSIQIHKDWKPTSIYHSLKHIELAEKSSLSLGGSWRFIGESFINEEFEREGEQDNIWYLKRLMFHAHFKYENKFEIFAELGSSWVNGKNHRIPVDMDALYVNQLFARYKIFPNWDLVFGRKNFLLGSRRLVDVREGPNVRRSFDFAEVNFQIKSFEVKTFFAVPMEPRRKVFDNKILNFGETFSGIYTTSYFSEKALVDAYAFYQKDDGAIYQEGMENERRVTIGLRHYGKYKKWFYNNEMVYQFGKFGNLDIQAWTLSFNIERETKVFGQNLIWGLKTEAISGDNKAGDSKLNTFDALYPRGAYFGKVAKFGPSNLIDVHPYINTTFNNFWFEIDFAAFWRYSLEDGVYGAALALDYPDLNNSRFIAHQIGVIVAYEFNSFINIGVESNVIFPGTFLRENNMVSTLYHFVLTTDVKF